MELVWVGKKRGKHWRIVLRVAGGWQGAVRFHDFRSGPTFVFRDRPVSPTFRCAAAVADLLSSDLIADLNFTMGDAHPDFTPLSPQPL